MSMMPPPPGIILNAPDLLNGADAADAASAASVSLRAQKAAAKQKEREITLGFIAKFEARLQELTDNPPAELSPIKRQAHLESLQYTIADLRRQIAPRRSKARLSSSSS